MSRKRNIILMPTDFSKRAAAVVPWVRRLADTLDAEVHCVFVIQEPPMYGSMELGPVAIPTPRELARSARENLDSWLARHLGDLAPAVERVVLNGRAADEIADYATKKKASMIVMATHGYSGLKHLLLGSTAEGVLRQSPCPVLSVRSR
jgi:nucleotide-binding universal stress UspA family protein